MVSGGIQPDGMHMAMHIITTQVGGTPIPRVRRSVDRECGRARLQLWWRLAWRSPWLLNPLAILSAAPCHSTPGLFLHHPPR